MIIWTLIHTVSDIYNGKIDIMSGDDGTFEWRTQGSGIEAESDGPFDDLDSLKSSLNGLVTDWGSL